MSGYSSVMIDLETMGNSPRSPIVSIGAVAFNGTGQEPFDSLPSFYCNVNLQSSIDAGLIPDASTVYWWLTQSEHARKALTDPAPIPLKQALGSFSMWFGSHNCENPEEIELWSHSTFDPPIVRSAADACGCDLPWNRRKTRDIRTLTAIGKLLGFDEPPSQSDNKEPGKHNALLDCFYQIGYVRTLLQQIQALRTLAAIHNAIGHTADTILQATTTDSLIAGE